MRDPQTMQEWQDAADAAHAALALVDARLYGLVEGGPDVDGDRCREILFRAEGWGVHPSAAATEEFVRALLSGAAE